jgi:hypothetical protein
MEESSGTNDANLLLLPIPRVIIGIWELELIADLSV